MNVPAVTASLASTARSLAAARRRSAARFSVFGLLATQRCEAATFGAAVWQVAEAAGRGAVRSVVCTGSQPAEAPCNPAWPALGYEVEWGDGSKGTLLVVATSPAGAA